VRPRTPETGQACPCLTAAGRQYAARRSIPHSKCDPWHSASYPLLLVFPCAVHDPGELVKGSVPRHAQEGHPKLRSKHSAVNLNLPADESAQDIVNYQL